MARYWRTSRRFVLTALFTSSCPPQLVRRGAAGAVVRGGRVRAADPAHGGAPPQRGRGGVGAGGGQGGAGAAPAALGGGQHRHPQGQVK